MLLGPIFSRLFTCSNAEKYKLKKTKGACSSPISMDIDSLTACTVCLVCFINTVNGCIQKKKPIKTAASSGHITNLKQSILETCDIWSLLLALSPTNVACVNEL